MREYSFCGRKADRRSWQIWESKYGEWLFYTLKFCAETFSHKICNKSYFKTSYVYVTKHCSLSISLSLSLSYSLSLFISLNFYLALYLSISYKRTLSLSLSLSPSPLSLSFYLILYLALSFYLSQRLAQSFFLSISLSVSLALSSSLLLYLSIYLSYSFSNYNFILDIFLKYFLPIPSDSMPHASISDRPFLSFSQSSYRLLSLQFLLLLLLLFLIHFSLSSLLQFDAIVTDPPYSKREKAVTSTSSLSPMGNSLSTTSCLLALASQRLKSGYVKIL